MSHTLFYQSKYDTARRTTTAAGLRGLLLLVLLGERGTLPTVFFDPSKCYIYSLLLLVIHKLVARREEGSSRFLVQVASGTTSNTRY
jgi:hypothetical protein